MRYNWAKDFNYDPITRFLTLRHKKSWKIKRINKQLVNDGFRAIRGG